MDSSVSEIIEEFMGSALVQWVQLFEKIVEREDGILLYNQYMEVNSITCSACDRYMRLTDGIFLNEVMRLIDPNPTVEQLYDSERDDHMLRIQNFSILNRHLRAFYQEDLQELILMPLPNVAILGQEPLTEAAVEELRRLLLLLLGCAVQCEKKDIFIKQIQCLHIESQAAIACCIQQVTQDPRMLLPLRWEELVESESADLELVFSTLTKHIQGLLAQRDTHLERMAELCLERESQVDSTMAPLGGRSEEPPQGLSVQLADSKAKLRHLKQQMEDKSEQILDYRQEMQAMEEQLKKLQKENRTLQGESRAMRALRDELDCARERATRADHLHTELQTCKHRLRTLELTRTQLKEQQQLCTALQETKALLEEQLADARVRCSLERELERDNLLLRQRIIDVEVERDTERQRVDELLEINMTLEAELRNSDIIPEPVPHRLLQLEVDSDEEMKQIIDHKPLSVEVGEASMLRLLGEEQQNTELKRRLEVLQAQQEASSLYAKDKLACVKMEHQNTLQEIQQLKNENTTLKQHLEKLVTKLQLQDEKGKEEKEKRPKREEEKVEKGLQESCRGEGEGRMRIKEESESRGVIVGSNREAGVGEEGLHIQLGKGEPCDMGAESKSRGEAEGGQKTRRGEAEGGQKDKQDNEKGIKKVQTITAGSETQKHPKKVEDNSITTAADRAECSIFKPDVEILTNRVKEVQEEADRQAMVADDLRLKLGEQSKKTWEAEQKLVVMKAELQHFKKAANGLGDARRQIETFQLEGLVMEEELCRLRSQAELHSMQTTVIATLEGERATLERDRDMLRSNKEAMRTAQRKGDQLEFAAQTLRAELERQSRSLETSRHREAELEAELCEATLEAESLARVRDQALLETARLEHEKEVLQSELGSQCKEGRQREREAMRLRQQLDSTTLALEHSNQRSRALDADHRCMRQQLSDSKELCNQLQDLEKELSSQLTSMEESKQQLQEQYEDSQAKISALSQDLTNEKILSKELTAEVERVHQKLQHTEADLRTTTGSLYQSQERIESLSQYIKMSESPPQVGQRRGSVAVDAPTNANSDSSNKVHVYQADSHEIPHQSTDGNGCNPPMLQDYATGLAEKQLSERMIELDKERAVAVAGQEALMFKLSQSQEAFEHLKEQVEALRRNSLSLQDSCTRLQTLNTQLQVEKASLSTQQAAIQARCSDSEVRCAAQEAEAKVWAQEREDLVARIEALRHDHERMMALQQRQEVELEELLDKHSQLRSNNRSLEAQHRELETRHKELLDSKTLMEEKELEIKMEREKIKAETQRTLDRERELEKLKEENGRLQAQQTESFALQTELLAQGSVLRGELSNSQLERMRLEGELSSLRESRQSLDLSNARLTSQYQLLTQLKGNMEEENRHLAEQNQSLLKENRALLEQSLECRDQHYSQQREYQEKLSELRREKQKLVEKIMDQYRVLEPSIHSPSSKAKKSNWIADRMKKLIKPRGGSKEGRAIFTALGSVENLADSTENTPDAHTPHPASDLRSAPVSPSPTRKAEPNISGPATPMVCSGSRGRPKLGSRRGWGIGVASGGSGVSQSFSPGDHKTPNRLRLRSNQTSFVVPWEGETVEAISPKAAEAPLTGQGAVMVDQGRCDEAKVE